MPRWSSSCNGDGASSSLLADPYAFGVGSDITDAAVMSQARRGHH